MGSPGLLSLADIETDTLIDLVDRSCGVYTNGDNDLFHSLDGQCIGVLFTHTSTRTRTAFIVGTIRLGGTPVIYGPGDLQLNTGESIGDTGRILGLMLDAMVARTAGPLSELRELADSAGIPVINAMTAEEHPSQGIADLATIKCEYGCLEGIEILYLGEGNNTAAALVNGVAHLRNCTLTLATPPGYGVDEPLLSIAQVKAEALETCILQVHSLEELPDTVDVVYTTRWQTTGTSKLDPRWRESFRPFYVDQALVDRWPRARFMHDLPAHRGDEVSSEVIDGPRSIAWMQARMKLASAIAIMERLCDSK